MLIRGRGPAALIAGVAALLLAAGPAPSANASATEVPVGGLTLAAALRALPAAADVPPLRLLHARDSTQSGAGVLTACGSRSRLALGGVGAQVRVYGSAVGPQFDPAGVKWVVGVRVYETTEEARVDRQRIVAGERQCAAVRSDVLDGAAVTVRRVAGRSVDAGGWSGYRSVDVWSNAPKENPLLSIGTFLQRGNVVVEVVEVTAGPMPASRASRWFRQTVRLVCTALFADSAVVSAGA